MKKKKKKIIITLLHILAELEKASSQVLYIPPTNY